jgi:hypothetical protein
VYSRALACTGGIFVPGEPKTKKSRRILGSSANRGNQLLNALARASLGA